MEEGWGGCDGVKGWGGVVAEMWRRRAVEYNEQCRKALTFVNSCTILDYGRCLGLVRPDCV